ncbi:MULTISPECIES: fumarate hydratase [Symbiopectobacterium]|uniref:fumarate hydratase n=1 Tax=Symbiopectobacterium TaxID=801 RepID=UPI002079F5EF|nr:MULTISPECIES: fumarate hydratase [Symbiopectobacterium]MBT9430200.1 fumarate hydratase [Candidatus Symbiopectobacterium endolongispinus]
MSQNDVSTLTEIMTHFTGYVGKRLPTDVIKKLEELRSKEKDELSLARVVYDSMFENQKQADLLDRPCCQDTGVIQYFITAGSAFPYLGELESILQTATEETTKKAPLRHNAVETFIEKNTGTNTESRIPWLDWEIIPHDDSCTIEVYMGSSLVVVAEGMIMAY